MGKLSTFENNQLILKLIGIKQKKFILKIRFKVSMINNLGNCFEETVIANNKKQEKMNLQTLNPNSYIRSELCL